MSEETPTNKLVLRADYASYMDVGTDPKTPKYALMGDGFSSLTESKNAQEYSRKYVNMRTEATDVVGYAPAIAYTCDVYSADPCIKRIHDVTKKELTGTDAQTNIVNVDLWQPYDDQKNKGYFSATRRTYTIIPDAKGDGTDALILSGNFKAVGDIVTGGFNPTDNTFKTDEELAAAQ